MAMTFRDGVMTVLISAAVCGLGTGLYDRFVRQPRTPRLAVVDVGSLVAQERQIDSLAAIRAPGTATLDTQIADYGTRLQGALEATARDCNCTLVAMPAVFGNGTSIPDLTAIVRARLSGAPK